MDCSYINKQMVDIRQHYPKDVVNYVNYNITCPYCHEKFLYTAQDQKDARYCFEK